jgi:hypothetical protein
MAVPSCARTLSEREEALIREVAALLQPTLAEIDRKVASITQQLSDLLAQLDTDNVRALLARLEAAPGADQRDSVYELGGSQDHER